MAIDLPSSNLLNYAPIHKLAVESAFMNTKCKKLNFNYLESHKILN